MEKFTEWLKNFLNTNKLLIFILIFIILIFFKTCSINYNRDFRALNQKVDSTLILFNEINKNQIEINNSIKLIKDTEYDIIQYLLQKDELANKQKVISQLKKRIILLKQNENK